MTTFTKEGNDNYDENRRQLYVSCINTLASYTTPDGYIGLPTFQNHIRRRLTHQYIKALTACGFPEDTPALINAEEWLLKSRMDKEDDFGSDFDKIEAAIRMKGARIEYCAAMVEKILRARQEPVDSRMQFRRQPFYSLWSAKILLLYQDRYKDKPECITVVKEILAEIENIYMVTTTTSRDMSFLISLHIMMDPELIYTPRLTEMVARLMRGYNKGLFDVTSGLEPVMDDLVKNGLASYLSYGVEQQLYTCLVGTTYVIENMEPVCKAQLKYAEQIDSSAQALSHILRPAINDLSTVFTDPYQQIMLSARALSAYAMLSKDEVSKWIFPYLLNQLNMHHRQKKLEEHTAEKRHLQKVLKEWLIVDWAPENEETLGGGYSGATVKRIHPSIQMPFRLPEDQLRPPTPNLDSIIVKHGLKVDLDRERRNYSTIPPDYRDMFASIPKSAYSEVINDQVVEYLIIEDLFNFSTLQEVVQSGKCTTETVNGLIDYLKKMYEMTPSIAGDAYSIFNKFFLLQTLSYLDTIFEFKRKIDNISDDDKLIDERLRIITSAVHKDIPLRSSVMHGDLNARNIMCNQDSMGVWHFRLIDLDKFTRCGDYVYDLGELTVDISDSIKPEVNALPSVDISNMIFEAFSKSASIKDDKWFVVRYKLGRARSFLKLAEISARKGLEMLGANIDSNKHVKRNYEGRIESLLISAYKEINSIKL